MKLKENRIHECDAIFRSIFSDLLVEASGERIRPGEWVLDSETLESIPDGQVLLVAHHRRVSRFLAIISHDTDETHREKIPGVYRRILHRIVIRKPGTSKKSRIYLKQQSAVKFISIRRGIYAINRDFMNKNIIATKVGPREYKLTPEVEQMLYIFYRESIYGIEQKPKTVKHVHADKGIEQFLLKQYPTREWQQVFEHLVRSKIQLQQRKQKDVNGSDDEEDELSIDATLSRDCSSKGGDKGSFAEIGSKHDFRSDNEETQVQQRRKRRKTCDVSQSSAFLSSFPSQDCQTELPCPCCMEVLVVRTKNGDASLAPKGNFPKMDQLNNGSILDYIERTISAAENKLHPIPSKAVDRFDFCKRLKDPEDILSSAYDKTHI